MASEDFESLIALVRSLALKFLLLHVTAVRLMSRRRPLQRFTDKYGLDLFLRLDNELWTFLEWRLSLQSLHIVVLRNDFLWVRNELLRL